MGRLMTGSGVACGCETNCETDVPVDNDMHCPKRRGVNTYNHKVMRQVDSAKVDIILGL